MSDSILVAIASLIGNILTIVCGIKLISYRVEQLEKKVEKHNQFYDKVNALDTAKNVNNIEHKNFDRRISNIERSFNYGDSTQI